MKKILSVCCLAVSILGYSQIFGKCKSDNVFRDIKLGSNISNYPKFLKKNSANEEYFGTYGDSYDYILNPGGDPNYTTIGQSKIYRIFAHVTEENIIDGLVIVTEKNIEVENMIDAAYGTPKSYNKEKGYKRWTDGDGLECQLNGLNNGKNYHMVYTQW